MAVYMHPTHGRRNALLVGALALVLGAAGGYLVGHGSADTGAEIVAHARNEAGGVVTALDRLTIEYEQVGAGESTATLTEAVDAASSALDRAVAAAPWLDGDAAAPARDGLDQLRDDIAARVAPSRFASDLEVASDAVARLFGLDRSGRAG